MRIIRYKIIDEQLEGREFANGHLFRSKEEARQELCSYHSIDWTGVNDDDTPKDIDTLSLDEILEYGEWSIKEIRTR